MEIGLPGQEVRQLGDQLTSQGALPPGPGRGGQGLLLRRRGSAGEFQVLDPNRVAQTNTTWGQRLGLSSNKALNSHSIVSDSLQPMDCSLSGSSVHGILHKSILEWLAIPFSRGSSLLRD